MAGPVGHEWLPTAGLSLWRPTPVDVDATGRAPGTVSGFCGLKVMCPNGPEGIDTLHGRQPPGRTFAHGPARQPDLCGSFNGRAARHASHPESFEAHTGRRPWYGAEFRM
jgi:hypothetical protein